MVNFKASLESRKTKTLLIVGLFVLAATASIFIYQIQSLQNSKSKSGDSPAKGLKDVTSFEECAKAGYRILMTYPRQCKTPDGITFTERVVMEESTIDTNSSCQRDENCQLINQDLGFSYCWTGCDRIDYFLAKWIAVNREWYAEQRAKNRPKTCGPAPMCNPRPIDDNFTAQCTNGRCQKVPK